jgi:hypothetical protein
VRSVLKVEFICWAIRRAVHRARSVLATKCFHWSTHVQS